MSSLQSRELAVVIQKRVLEAAWNGVIPDYFSDAETWCARRLAELAESGENASIRVVWRTDSRRRHFSVMVRRGNGEIENPPNGVAKTLVVSVPEITGAGTALSAAMEKRKRKAAKLEAAVAKGALKRCT